MKEYERAVIFRLGRITARKAKGPGKQDHLNKKRKRTLQVSQRSYIQQTNTGVTPALV